MAEPGDKALQTLSDDLVSVMDSENLSKEIMLSSESFKASKPRPAKLVDDLSAATASTPSRPAEGAPSPKPKAKPKAVPTSVSTTMAWRKSTTKGATKWSSTAGFKDSLTGEQISRAKAISEVSKVQAESAMKILDTVTNSLKIDPDDVVDKQLLERIDSEMEKSKTLLLQHSRGLLGSDLAELRILKSEKKAILDKMARKNKAFTQEIGTLRQRLRNFPEENSYYVERILKSVTESSSLQDFGRDSQACILTILEQKLNSVFSLPLGKKPEPEVQAQMKPQSRAENSFLKERVGRLEEQVQLLAEKIATVQRQHAILVAIKEKLQADIEDIRVSSSSPSRSHSNTSGSSSRRHMTG